MLSYYFQKKIITTLLNKSKENPNKSQNKYALIWFVITEMWLLNISYEKNGVLMNKDTLQVGYIANVLRCKPNYIYSHFLANGLRQKWKQSFAKYSHLCYADNNWP